MEAIKRLLQAPLTPAELDIPTNIMLDIMFRVLFTEGHVALRRLGDVLKLELKLLDAVLLGLQEEHLVEVASTGNLGRLSYAYSLTDAGVKRARDSLERGQYVGPAPVPIEKYGEMMIRQTEQRLRIPPAQVRDALAHLVLPEDFHRRVGPAINAGSSLFLYGPPGNGKTSIAYAVGQLVGAAAPVWIPYAITIAGHIISIYDPQIFEEVPLSKEQLRLFRAGPDTQVDRRWGLFRRPSVVVGGELTMDALDLRFDPIAKFYEAPLQLKANGGMFLIDDFGRQRMPPLDLLNRWIVPLEMGFDFLRLLTGQTIQVPFRELIVFSTNLDPLQLVDDAFLRRIQMKVHVGTPDERMFFQIFVTVAQQMGIPLDKDGFLYYLQHWYRECGRILQAVHPRDILKILVQMADYEGRAPRLTPEAIDAACESYFVAAPDLRASVQGVRIQG